MKDQAKIWMISMFVIGIIGVFILGYTLLTADTHIGAENNKLLWFWIFLLHPIAIGVSIFLRKQVEKWACWTIVVNLIPVLFIPVMAMIGILAVLWSA